MPKLIKPILRLTDVRKVFGDSPTSITALDGLNISFEPVSFTAIMGPSGSGKSTLLNCAAGLEYPTSGSVMLDDIELQTLNDDALTKLRRDRIGFIFQSFNLLPALTAQQNITLPLQFAHKHIDLQLVHDILIRVGLDSRAESMPHELSGGQRQRVAIARALAMQPAVIFADEPTGSLDTQMALEVLDLLRETVRTAKQTVIMVTHDPVAASHADRVIFLADGQIVDELKKPSADTIAERMTRFGSRNKIAATGKR